MAEDIDDEVLDSQKAQMKPLARLKTTVSIGAERERRRARNKILRSDLHGGGLGSACFRCRRCFGLTTGSGGEGGKCKLVELDFSDILINLRLI